MNTQELKELSERIARGIFNHMVNEECDKCPYSVMGCSIDTLIDFHQEGDLEQDKKIFCAAHVDIILKELQTYAK